MCGIAGIVSLGNEAVGVEELMPMADRLSHRGPDGYGYWISPLLNVGFAHRRLAILDLSEAGKQPMTRGAWTITFNGEIYNYLEVREELLGLGETFKTGTDTEVLLAAFDVWGEACLSRLDGMFAFAIYNSETEETRLFRDRFGEKPLFYCVYEDRLYFASEMKALWEAGVPRRINERLLFQYLVYDAVEDFRSSEATFYEEIKKLEPASMLKVTTGEIQKSTYWTLRRNERDMSSEEALERFYSLFEASIKRRLRSDVPVGSSLSGGLDSSSIVLVIDKLFREQGIDQKAFSARFDDPTLDEGKYMALVVDRANVAHHEVWPDGSFLGEQLDKVFYHQEEPFGSASIVAQWAVMGLAKEHNTTVLLDGQGADETLAGYLHFFTPFVREQMLAGKLAEVKRDYQEVFGKNFTVGGRDYAEAYMPGVVRGVGKLRRSIAKPAYLADVPEDFARAFAKLEPPFRSVPNLNETLLHATMGYGLAKLLRFSDRNAMAHSREVRLPFLSHELVEFLFSVPSYLKIHKGWTKWLLRKSMEHILPPEIAWRKDKLGFRPPQKEWMLKGKVAERVSSAESDLATAGYIRSPNKLDQWRILMGGMLLNSCQGS